jgi:hypothetical protein
MELLTLFVKTTTQTEMQRRVVLDPAARIILKYVHQFQTKTPGETGSLTCHFSFIYPDGKGRPTVYQQNSGNATYSYQVPYMHVHVKAPGQRLRRLRHVGAQIESMTL